MNTVKTIKSYTFYILLVMCGFVVWYLAAAFVLLEINFTNWAQNVRLLVLIQGAVTSVAAIAIYQVGK